MTDWTDVAALIAKNATTLSESHMLRLLETDDTGVVNAMSARADLTEAVVGELLEHHLSDEFSWGLRTLAGNAHLTPVAQRLVVNALLTAGRSLDADMRCNALVEAAKVITDPTAIGAIVAKATTGRVPTQAWIARASSDFDKKAAGAYCEHAVLALADRGDVDDALAAADLLPRLMKRLPQEKKARGKLGESPLAAALASYGTRHLPEYEQAVVASGDLDLLTRIAHRKVLSPTTRAAIDRAVQTAVRTAVAAHTPLPGAADELIYRGWDMLTADTKALLEETLSDGRLSTSRRDWIRNTILSERRKAARATETDHTRDQTAQRWAALPADQLRAALETENWRVDINVLNVLWARTDLPDGLSIELMRCANPIGFAHAPALRPYDREFAIALYTRCPGMIPEDLPVHELREIVIALSRGQRGAQYSNVIVSSDYYTRLGARRYDLPGDVALELARHDKDLAVHLADQYAACLGNPGAELLPSLVDGLTADQPLTAATVALTAATAA